MPSQSPSWNSVAMSSGCRSITLAATAARRHSIPLPNIGQADIGATITEGSVGALPAVPQQAARHLRQQRVG